MKTNLAEQLAARRDVFAAKAKPGWLETMNAAIEALRESGAAERAPDVGDQAPAFSLPTMDGETVSLQEVLASGPVILSFYRGGW